jgi:DMSO/TMAO reductase YedYZ molybdopterin-dependent catalytic subunit
MKSLAIDHTRDGKVMIAFSMNGEQLQLLNGFPLKLIVPGWCAVYWIKMLNDIEVLDQPDTNYWTATGYRVPEFELYGAPMERRYATTDETAREIRRRASATAPSRATSCARRAMRSRNHIGPFRLGIISPHHP